MNTLHYQISSGWLQRGAIRMFQVVALALLLPLAIPVRAEERAVKSRVPPVYPEIAKRMKISGVVIVDATVAPDGKVSDTKVVRGNSALGPAAEEAVRKWRFVPADTPSTVTVAISFSLGQ